MADRRSTFLRGLGHPRGCIGVCRVHTWLFCTLCIARCDALATIHYLFVFSHFIPLNGDAFRLIAILCLFRERTVNIWFPVYNIVSFQFQNCILLAELLLFIRDNGCLEFSWIQENCCNRFSNFKADIFRAVIAFTCSDINYLRIKLINFIVRVFRYFNIETRNYRALVRNSNDQPRWLYFYLNRIKILSNMARKHNSLWIK